MEKTVIYNWGRDWHFSPSKVLHPKNLEELRQIVLSNEKIRVMGSRHAWSGGIITGDTLISLQHLDKVGKVDKATKTVTVGAGIQLKNLLKALEIQGYTIINMGSYAEQTLAGAISTATHGSGLNFQCLASQVVSFRLMDAAGNVLSFQEGEEHYHAILTGFGCFGITFEMTIRVTESFQMDVLTEGEPYEQVVSNVFKYAEQYDHFRMWWMVPDDRMVAYKFKRIKSNETESGIKRWFRDVFFAVYVYRAFLLLGKLHPPKLVPFINGILSKFASKRRTRISRSYHAFLTPQAPLHKETEWAFDFKDAQRLLTEYRELMLQSGHTYNFVQSLRITKGDNFWMSPCYGRDSLWLSCYNIEYDDAKWKDQLRKFQAWAMKNGGRPHFGKFADVGADYYRTVFPKFNDFVALMKQYDPKGKFRNEWVERSLFT